MTGDKLTIRHDYEGGTTKNSVAQQEADRAERSETRELPRAVRPCGECPWRRDQPAGRFPACRYEALRNTSADTDGASVPLGAPMFGCHKSPEGAEMACAGWLAVEGHRHVGVRLAVATGQLDPEALHPGEGWPELYASYQEMAEFNGCEDEPTPGR